MQPLVSIIMNCKNSSKYLREAIDSVYAQDYENWEIIFWDNGSTDESPEIVKERDERLRYFGDDAFMKLGKARNLAMAKANGKYLTFLDCDDKWLPEKLAKQVAEMEEKPIVDFIYSNYFRMIMPNADKLILGLNRKQPEGNVFERFLYNYPVNLQTVMLRAQAVKKLAEKFDDTLELSEEFDFFMRLLFKSKALYIDKPLAVYRVHPEMASLKLIDRYPGELECVMGKFKKLDSSFEDKYSPAIRYYEAKLGYWRARSEMERGEQKRARIELEPHKFTDVRFFVLYIATYMPLAVWKRLHHYKLQGMLRWVENG